MIAIHRRVLPTERDCDRLGQVMVWNNKLQYWCTGRLERVLLLLEQDPDITHWQRMPDPPQCYADEMRRRNV